MCVCVCVCVRVCVCVYLATEMLVERKPSKNKRSALQSLGDLVRHGFVC